MKEILFLALVTLTSAFNYTILTQTSCVPFAGTNAKVFISILGREYKTISSFLPTRGNFKKCQKDVFYISSFIDIKDICSITIGHGINMIYF